MNTQVRDLFQNYDKGRWHSTPGTPLPFSASDLFEERTMEKFYHYVHQNLDRPFSVDDESGQKKLYEIFTTMMVQQNSKQMVKAHFQLKFQKDLHDNYTAGFATSETNVAMLTDESKYFVSSQLQTLTQYILFMSSLFKVLLSPHGQGLEGIHQNPDAEVPYPLRSVLREVRGQGEGK